MRMAACALPEKYASMAGKAGEIVAPAMMVSAVRDRIVALRANVAAGRAAKAGGRSLTGVLIRQSPADCLCTKENAAPSGKSQPAPEL
ncbi:hypothetical protein N5A92_20440 [Chelativorans sp. EGI FJ00035]|uniref:Uncharacterized protein n=1 Tax=Chelativorans salis TaxID=2978478 RepID=A0ABT2LS85_9HYPH|nr:hypothetical protein [Chelativorans sp. EGI FJ00035]MCT7377390.1 hypothetical protein [Chelativorans sp. EGI FJ00035]